MTSEQRWLSDEVPSYPEGGTLSGASPANGKGASLVREIPSRESLSIVEKSPKGIKSYEYDL